MAAPYCPADGQVAKGETTLTAETSSTSTPRPLVSSEEPTSGGASRPRPPPTTQHTPLVWQTYLEIDSECYDNVQVTAGDPSELCLGSVRSCQILKINPSLVAATVDATGSPPETREPTVLTGPNGAEYTTGQHRIDRFRVGARLTWTVSVNDRSSRCCFAITSLDLNATTVGPGGGLGVANSGSDKGKGSMGAGWIALIGVVAIAATAGAVAAYRRLSNRPDMVYRFDNATLMRDFTSGESNAYGEDVDEDTVYPKEHDVRRRGSGPARTRGKNTARTVESRL
jgi:hypothetical protein